MKFAAAAISGPKIDWMAISPLVALTGGACVVLMAGPAALAASCASTLVPLLTLVALGAPRGLADRDLGRQRQRDLRRDARWTT